MRCDMKTILKQKDTMGEDQEIFPQCPRERVNVVKTRFGRMGLCGPCQLAVIATPPTDLSLRLRRGIVVMDKLPK